MNALVILLNIVNTKRYIKKEILPHYIKNSLTNCFLLCKKLLERNATIKFSWMRYYNRGIKYRYAVRFNFDCLEYLDNRD